MSGAAGIAAAWVSVILVTGPMVAAAQSSAEPDRDLGTVTVIGRRVSSLPTRIPTTIEGIGAEELEVRINATDAEDALKYLPSLLVRKRYIGDYDHAVLASRASGTGNSARSLVYADGILLSNLLGNGATFTPRWGLVTPEEIERVDVLYGPFSAAYPGNSVGAVVDYVTRMPEQLEVRVRVATFAEDFAVYASEGTFSGWQTGVSAGDRAGDWAWWLNFNRLDSTSHPISFANKLVDAGVPGSAGTVVTGAIEELNPRNLEWLILGSTTNTSTRQDHAKLKVAYDLSADAKLTYTLGWWANDAQRRSETYLRDAVGNPVYSGPINVAGRTYTLAATDFAPSVGASRHFIHGLALDREINSAWSLRAQLSAYDYDRDVVRSPTVAPPGAATGGAGRIADQSGTGWSALAVKLTRQAARADGHFLDVGYQLDDYSLRTRVAVTDDWLRGGPTSSFSSFRGDASLASVYAQDTWAFAPRWRTTLGVRVERWRAENGALGAADLTLPFPARTATYVSPKLAIARELRGKWTVKASLGRAVRMPTVAELYQGSIATNVIVNNDPSLRPERSWTSELTSERLLPSGTLRATVFLEDTADALYSQTNVTVTPAVTSIQNVDEIRTRGAEIAFVAWELLDGRLELATSLTYARSRIERNANFPASVGKWQPRVPEWRANALATYRFGQTWSLTAGARYSGMQYNTLDNSDPNGSSFTGTSPFVVFDLRARMSRARWSAAFGIDNVGNEEYWAFHPYTRRSLLAEVSVGF